MPRIAPAVLILFALTAGCSRTGTASESSVAATAITEPPPSRPSLGTETTPQTATATSVSPSTTAADQTNAVPIATRAVSPETAATQFVEALIEGQAPPDSIAADLWRQTLQGGRIIQTPRTDRDSSHTSTRQTLMMNDPGQHRERRDAH